MTEVEYKNEWLAGKHQTDYNAMRFADDKVALSLERISKLYGSDYVPHRIRNLSDYILEDVLYNDDQLKSIYADKMRVYDVVDNELLIPLDLKHSGKLAVSDLDDVELRNKIIKCNHGSGWNIRTTNKSYAVEKLNGWMDLNYAYVAPVFERQYENIEPGIIVQPILEERPIDWQLFYVEGNLEVVELSRKAGKNVVSILATVDKNGDESEMMIGGKPLLNKLNRAMKNSLREIRESADELAKKFKFVRLDYFYLDRPYICEFTFSPSAGYIELVNRVY